MQWMGRRFVDEARKSNHRFANNTDERAVLIDSSISQPAHHRISRTWCGSTR